MLNCIIKDFMVITSYDVLNFFSNSSGIVNAKSVKMRIRIKNNIITFNILYTFLILMCPFWAYPSNICSNLFISEIENTLLNPLEHQIISLDDVNIVLSYEDEAQRLKKISNTLLSFKLSFFDNPELSWPKKDRAVVRSFFKNYVDHNYRSRFFYNFTVVAVKELNESGTQAEKNKYISKKQLPLHIIRKILVEMAENYGFKVISIDQALSDREFESAIKSGSLLIDDYFFGVGHGAYTHLFQILQIASSLDAEYGLGTTLKIYKSMGHEKRIRKWKEYFDDNDGSEYSPENYNTVLRKYFLFY